MGTYSLQKSPTTITTYIQWRWLFEIAHLQKVQVFNCINSYLTAAELAYILTNSQSKVLLTSKAKLDVAREALQTCPDVKVCVVMDGPGESERIIGLQQATADLPGTPILDENIGVAMLYSSGTTGRPKGILRPLPQQPLPQLQRSWACSSSSNSITLIRVSRWPKIQLRG